MARVGGVVLRVLGFEPVEIVEKLAADVGDGLRGQAVEDALGELKTNGPLWQLKVNCLRYCRQVDAHHAA